VFVFYTVKMFMQCAGVNLRFLIWSVAIYTNVLKNISEIECTFIVVDYARYIVYTIKFT
jgi:hypothetical protein